MPRGWWKKRHEETLAAPGRKDTQIAFIGDSITDGWDSEGGGLKIWEEEYVPMKALNLGINCDSTQHVLWRLDHGAVDDLPDLKVAVVMIGVNNKGINRHKGEDVAAGIAAVCGKLRAKAPHARILLLNVFPRGFGRDMSTDINSTISKLHEGRDIFYLNINETLVKTEGAIRDRVGHLTEKGYEVWAEQIRPTLKELMKEPGRKPGRGSGETDPARGKPQGTKAGPGAQRGAPAKTAADAKALLARLVEATEKGGKPSIYLKSMRARVEIIAATPDGKLRLSARGMSVAYDFSRLAEDDLKALALALGE